MNATAAQTRVARGFGARVWGGIVGSWHLAIREEREVRAEFGASYDEYAKPTPRFLPRLQVPVPPLSGSSP